MRCSGAQLREAIVCSLPCPINAFYPRFISNDDSAVTDSGFGLPFH
ncbi:hypothetical protein NPX99_04160 [Bartonella sp. 220]|nr:hypothetical protein [Bartonella sp. 220B]MCZ2158473.1 hypothetical protein [Bartonella sp. 220B]